MANTINQEPGASGLLPTDSVLVWNVTQTPHTQHAPITLVLQAMSTLPATFASVKIGGVSLVPGPTTAQFNALNSSAAANNTSLSSIQSRVTSLQTRVAALESGGTAIVLNNIPDQTIGTSFTVSGTISGVTVLPALEYQDNSGAWTSTTSITQPESLTVNAISSVLTGTTFSVSGNISNATSTPTLQYQDTISGTAGSWTAFPGGSTVSQSAYSFLHPSFSSASTTVTVGVRDANATSITAISNAFSVGTESISINQIGNVPTSTAFSVFGTISNATSTPTLQYQDTISGVAGAWTAFPAGSTVSQSQFTLNHPAYGSAASAATVGVRDANATSVVATSNTFSITGKSIALAPIGGDQTTNYPNPNTINVSGQLTGFQQPYNFIYTLNENGTPGGPIQVPGSPVTSFSFSISPVTLGSVFSVTVTDTVSSTTATTNEILVAAGSFSGTAQPIAGHSGNPLNHSINILLMGDGFTSTDDAAFNAAATNVATGFGAFVPYNSFSNKINIYKLIIHSNLSGVGQSGEHPSLVRNFFGTHFILGSRIMQVDNQPLIFEVARKFLPQYTSVLVIGNSGTYGGATVTPGLPIISLETSSAEQAQTAIHELGHAIYSLSDEYGNFGDPSSGNNWPGGLPAGPFGGVAINVTDTRAHCPASWAALNTSPAVTWTNPDCTTQGFYPSAIQSNVGLFETAAYYNCGLSRPQNNCLMRDNTTNTPFCAVCNAAISNYLTAL